jgi:ABC-2 type transport system permease protein
MVKSTKYRSVFVLAVIHTLKNYKELVGLSIFLVTCLVIFAHLWKLSAAKVGGVSFDPSQLLWYIAFNEWILVAVPEVQFEMEQDLRSGRLAYLLPRPVSYLGMVFSEAFGIFCVNLVVLGVVASTFTWFKIGELPFHFTGFFVIGVLSLLSGCVGIIFNILIGISAFWLQDVGPFTWIWSKLLLALGGLILPLTIYPEWMQTIARCTPFPAMLGERSALVFEFSLSSVCSVTSSLLIWGALGLICLGFLYRRGLRILNIEGG